MHARSYVSFSEANGTAWSACFDADAPLEDFCRALTLVAAHCTIHAGGAPPTAPLVAELSADAAGVVFRAWEFHTLASDLPHQTIKPPNEPFDSATDPDKPLKVSARLPLATLPFLPFEREVR